MSIRDVSNLSVKTPQENEFATNLRSIPSSILHDKLINSLGNDSFKSVLSESKETGSVKPKIKISEQDNFCKKVDKTEKDAERDDIEKLKSVLPESKLFFQQELIQSHIGEKYNEYMSNSPEIPLVKEDLESENVFGSQQEFLEQLPLGHSVTRSAGFSEPVIESSPNTQAQINREGVENETYLFSDIDLSAGRAIITARAEQQMDAAVLKSILAEQQASMPKVNMSTTMPMQNVSPLITPILLLNNGSSDEFLFGIDSDLGISVDGVTQKSTSFVEASQYQKQLFSKAGESEADGDSEKSFEGSEGSAQQVSANAADSVQKTLAAQKLTQVIKERAQDAIDKRKTDVNINVKGIQTTLGEVELDLKINNKKISVRLLSGNKDMQTLLSQERSQIRSILDALVKSTKESEYTLDENPVQISHKEF